MQRALALCCLLFLGAHGHRTHAQDGTVPVQALVQIRTELGTMVVALYNETPLHRDNFLALVRERAYDSLLFHRVIPGFMVQGGDPDSRHAAAGAALPVFAAGSPGLAAVAADSGGAASCGAAPSIRQTAASVTSSAAPDTLAVTAISRAAENGSSSRPATVAVTAKPAIIIIHTSVAPAARRSAATRLAKSTSSEVPQALTPPPMSTKDSAASTTPKAKFRAISDVATAAPVPPAASAAMPPTIHGVRCCPRSEPYPMRGRSSCIK